MKLEKLLPGSTVFNINERKIYQVTFNYPGLVVLREPDNPTSTREVDPERLVEDYTVINAAKEIEL